MTKQISCREHSMRALLVVVILGFVAACTPASLAAQDGERVLIRNWLRGSTRKAPASR